MARVIHVDGLDSGPLPAFSVAPDESLADVIHRLGGTFRIEHVPDEALPPRKLDEDAARFIAKYEREESESVIAVFRRYGSLDAEEFDSVEGAERYLDGSEDEFLLAGEAVVTADGTITVWS
jgi:hypothetical protein